MCEEEGDRGGDCFARLGVDRQAHLGQDEDELVFLAERERLCGRAEEVSCGTGRA